MNFIYDLSHHHIAASKVCLSTKEGCKHDLTFAYQTCQVLPSSNMLIRTFACHAVQDEGTFTFCMPCFPRRMNLYILLLEFQNWGGIDGHKPSNPPRTHSESLSHLDVSALSFYRSHGDVPPAMASPTYQLHAILDISKITTDLLLSSVSVVHHQHVEV